MTSHEFADICRAVAEVEVELKEAIRSWPKMRSAHEGYAILLEEVEELWQNVRVNQKKRTISSMRKEALQVAAMAIRFMVDVCNEEVGRK